MQRIGRFLGSVSDRVEDWLTNQFEWREARILFLIMLVTAAVMVVPNRPFMPLISEASNNAYALMVAIDGFAFLALFVYGFITINDWYLETIRRPSAKSVLDTQTIVVFIIQCIVLSAICAITTIALIVTFVDLGGSESDKIITFAFSLIFIAGGLFGVFALIFGFKMLRLNGKIISTLSA